MPRKPSVANDATVQLLKSYVKKKANFGTCTFGDVQQLQFKIKKEVDEYLSIQTLNRFFGLIKNDFKPAASTLNILARYVDCASFAEFELLHSKPSKEGSEPSASSALIVSLFSGIDASEVHEKGLMSVVKNICHLLEKDPHLAKEIYPFMATTPFGREYFYEQHVNINALNGHYGEGLSFYIMHTKEREQLFFAYSLLCFRYLLNCQYHLFRLYYNKLQDFTLAEVMEFSPQLVGRYFAVQVYNSIINETVVDVMDKAVITFTSLRSSKNFALTFPHAEFILGEALVLAGEYHMAWEVLQSGRIYVHQCPDADRAWITNYDIVQLYAGYAAGMVSQRKIIEEHKRLLAEPLHFLSTDFYTVLMHDLEESLAPETQRQVAAQTAEVVKKTGFIFFENKWNKPSVTDTLLMDIKGKKIG